MKRKNDYNSLPQAVTELYAKLENIEKLIIRLSEKLDAPIEDPKEKSVKARPYPISEEKVTVITEPSVAVINEDDLTVEQASAFLGITKTNLYSYVKFAKIPFSKRGRRLVFSKIELQFWLNSPKKFGNKIPKDAITFREAVKLTGLKPSKLQYEIKKRKVPVIGKQGKLLYYSKRELTKALTTE